MMLENPWVVVPLLIALYLTVYAVMKRFDWEKWRLVWAVWVMLIIILLTIELVTSL
ncbi:hypothetical protein PJK55_09870 [Exiguobacterium sp. MMG028]|uniref:hypothetical protein n=1 Tax=unclassified Exiguobacterium TaxID=2644629 RepID=UPI0013014823|nr:MULTISPECIES: hypothetical protein [unclassified Exiguobacterium]MDA5561038.1 hypothetical protein [Exiguobacterium sp. MMG028]